MASRLIARSASVDDTTATSETPVVAEVDGVRLRLHARELRGSMSLVTAARRAHLNRDELSRLERGETTQIRFSTIAKLLAAYDCRLEDLVEVEQVPATAPEPLYGPALAALSAGLIPVEGPRRRTTRRGPAADLVADGEERTFESSAATDVSSDAETGTGHEPKRRRRAPVGTVRG